jgi:hypothetical protein
MWLTVVSWATTALASTLSAVIVMGNYPNWAAYNPKTTPPWTMQLILLINQSMRLLRPVAEGCTAVYILLLDRSLRDRDADQGFLVQKASPSNDK